MRKVAVVGGGASGLMAAYFAGLNGAEVSLFEKNEKLGKKIYITGKGRCNLTNLCPPDEFLQNVVHGEKFLRSAIYQFPPQKLCDLLESNGLRLKTERGRRVFPVSDHASDVTKTLEKMCLEAGVHFFLNTEIKKINVLHSTMSDIVLSNGSFPCDAVILATGGLSYPSTGSTGDGLKFAKECGHSIEECRPSLTGIELKDNFSDLQGLSLVNVVLSAKHGEKKLFSQLGELLFTHYGVSGPLVLSLSALVNRMNLHEISLSIDLKPGLDRDKLESRILRDTKERGNEMMKNMIAGLLPARLGEIVLKRAEIPLERRANELRREERARLVENLKNFSLRAKKLRGFDEAVVTSGGVSLKEVDPKTMQSKLVKGLFFAGELLDVDAFTGGYNLQIAFSTGAAAGIGAAKQK